MNVSAGAGDIEIVLGYWAPNISEAQANKISSTFSKAISDIVENAEMALDQLDMFSEADAKQIMAWNSSFPASTNACIHDLVRERTALQPNSLAISSWDTKFTYTQLDQLSSRLAGKLVQDFGIRAEISVPLCFDKSAYAVVAMLAVMKAGGICVPLNPAHPKTRLLHILKSTNASLVLTSFEHRDLFEEAASIHFAIDAQSLSALPSTGPNSRSQPQDAAFAVFTSGSTGEPKGIVLEHRSLCTCLVQFGAMIQMTPSSRVFQFAAYTFDTSIADIFATLIYGGCVCIPSEHERMNDIHNSMKRLDINIASLTPTVAAFLIPDQVPNLKTLVLSGEAITQAIISTWAKRVRLLNFYGPAECTIWSVGYLVDSENLSAATIGRAIGSRTWVSTISDCKRLASIGSIGELLIEGPLVARGYLNNAQEESRVFVQGLPWLPKESSNHCRLYKTGDLVRYNSDGTLNYIGRKDTQVKIYGQRVELNEIEHQLRLQEKLLRGKRAAVEVVSSISGPILAAFISDEIEQTANSSEQGLLAPLSGKRKSEFLEFQQALAYKLPPYMVPSIFIPVNMLPLNTSGKLDRRALKQLVSQFSDTQRGRYSLSDVAKKLPTSKSEVDLQLIWSQVLKISPDFIGADDHFFRLGGDSVGAMRLVNAAHNQGIALTVAAIFQYPQLSQMAAAAQNAASDEKLDLVPFELISRDDYLDGVLREASSQCQVPEEQIEDVYPCTPLQEGLIALSTRQKGAYLSRIIFRLPPDLDVQHFRKCWEKAVKLNVILRTRIIYSQSMGSLQVVLKDPISWQTGQSLKTYLEDSPEISYGAPLVRFAIIEDHFVMSSHHAVYDGWSMRLLFKQVEMLFDGGDIETPINFNRFIQHLQMTDPVSVDAFWKSQFAGSRPSAFPQLPKTTYQPKPDQTVSSSMAYSRSEMSTFTSSTMIRAAWALVLGQHSDVQDVVFGAPLSGRNASVPGISNLVGPTITTVPVRIAFEGSQTISSFLKSVQDQGTEMIPFEHTGLQNIRRILDDDQRVADIKHLLVVQPQIEADTNQDFLGLESRDTESNDFGTYALTLIADIASDSIFFTAHYDETVVASGQMKRMLHRLQHVINQLTSDPDTLLNQIDVMSPEEKSRIMEWNLDSPTAIESCIHHLIHQQTTQNPQAPAICGWDGSFTYADVENLSNRLARYLRSLGVGTQTVVPLCFDKSSWTIISILAVLKAGGAYTQMNPTHPVARLEAIISAANAKVILTLPQHIHTLESLCSNVVAIQDSLWDIIPEDVTTLDNHVSPDDLAFIVFTSGSTGTSKGVELLHRSMCTMAIAEGPLMHLSSGTRTLQFATYTFDVSNSEILSTLIHGGCVCVPSEDQRINELPAIINSMDVNWLFLTPSVAELLDPKAVPSLQTLVLGGEAINFQLYNRWCSEVYLVNSYGPSECTIWTSMSRLGGEVKPANIGRGLAALTWVTMSDNHDRLAPIGSIGELLVEGPILARGYLNDPERTRESFITNPKWLDSHSHPRRLYKTGDLVCYNEDGTLNYVGRKDNQIKLRGQRIELGEIESHIGVEGSANLSMVVLPKSGPCKQQLLALLNFQGLSTSSSSEANMQLVSPEQYKTCATHVSRIQDSLIDALPAYMVPGVWIVVNAFPMTASGKLDRLSSTKFIESMDSATYERVMQVEEPDTETQLTPMERKVQAIWSSVLNIPVAKVSPSKPFLRLGGDSITAMQVVARCRAEKISLNVQELLRAANLRALAQEAKMAEDQFEVMDEKLDTPFDLSPIQRLYFNQIASRDAALPDAHHFNQHVLLHLTKPVSEETMASAINAVVGRHSMLRARFSQPQGSHEWMQFILDATGGSYTFGIHNVSHRQEIGSITADYASRLDLVHGPVFAAALFNIDGGSQSLFLVAHHLVIDLVSWRIVVHDIESLLRTQELAPTPLPFQNWCRQQQTHSQQSSNLEEVLPTQIPPADFEYWDMNGVLNLHKDEVSEKFSLDEGTTDRLFGNSNEALNTEPLDLIFASLVHSFHAAFPDRAPPTIFNEGHGREPWDTDIDLSETVGWFTTMTPLHIPILPDQGIVHTVRQTKDIRRRLPGNGRPYFASRFLTSGGRDMFKSHEQIEILLNYAGRYQQLERKDTLFKLDTFADTGMGSVAEIGDHIRRTALFEIQANVADGETQISVTFNSNMSKQDRVRSWLSSAKAYLQSAIDHLSSMRPEHTLADFPLIPLTYEGLDELKELQLPRMQQNSLDDLEDVYICSPVQRGIIFSQTRYPGTYKVKTISKIESTDISKPIETRRIAQAWQRVVDRHPSLRTVFFDSKSGIFGQAVLKKHTAAISQTQCRFGQDALATLKELQPLEYSNERPPHRLTICETSSGVYCALEISHALIDGLSMNILVRDLVLSYSNKLPQMPRSPYSKYIKHVQQQPLEQALSYWTDYLRNIEPCHIPIVQNQSNATEHRRIQVEIADSDAIHDLCSDRGITLSNLFQAVWALVLRSYCGSENVCFGYLTSGRDVPIKDINTTIGLFINILVCHVNLKKSLSAMDLARKVQDDFLQSLPHQFCSLAEIQHALDLVGEQLFNTCISFQREGFDDEEETSNVQVVQLDTEDPAEYDLTFNVGSSGKHLAINLGYWNSRISDVQAQNIAQTVTKIIAGIVARPDAKVESLDVLSCEDERQILEWNSRIPPPKDSCLHDLVDERINSSPDAVAVDAWDATLTYGELDLHASHLTDILIASGVSANEMIPVYFDKSAWAVVAMLAIIRAGGTCVALNTSHPKSRIAYLAQSVKAKIIVVGNYDHAEIFKEMDLNAIVVEKDLKRPNGNISKSRSRMRQTPDDAAFVVFTSGSTGEPKGIVLTHRGLSTSILYHGAFMGLKSSSRVMQYAAYSFDASIGEVFTALLHGGCVCVPSEDERMNDLSGAINRYSINWAYLTPTVANLLNPQSVKCLETLALIGEAVTQELVSTWTASHARLANVYGPAETTLWSNSLLFSADSNPANIGHGIGSLSWVVDSCNQDRLAPLGATGELFVEGPILSRGYLNEEMTKEYFVENPVWLKTKGNERRRMYKTGDLVRYNSDGAIIYVGRKDSQVKLYGQRIELGEIEHRIKAQLGIQHVAVDILPQVGSAKKRTLAAFFLLSDPLTEPSSADNLLASLSNNQLSQLNALHASLTETMPAYMMPSLFIHIKRLPLNASGKLDRRSLRQLGSVLSEKEVTLYSLSNTIKRSPSTEMEAQLQKLWAHVLQVAPSHVGADDSFFHLGGDSIVAMRLANAARIAGLSLTVSDIFLHPKLSHMATILNERPDASDFTVPSYIPFSLLTFPNVDTFINEEVCRKISTSRDNIHDVLPTTNFQDLSLTGHLMKSRWPLNYFYFDGEGPLDYERLEKQYAQMIAAFEIFRTVYILHKANYLQVILKEIGSTAIFCKTDQDLTTFTKRLQEDDRKNIIRLEEPLVKLVVVQRKDTMQYRIILRLSHAQYDGLCMPTIWKSLLTLEPPSLPKVAYNFSAFVADARSRHTAESFEYWRELLEGSSIPRMIPSARRENRQLTTGGLNLCRSIPHASSSFKGHTFATVIKAAWSLVLAQLSGSDDVVFGHVISGRNSSAPGLDQVVGPCLNIIPVRVKLDRDLQVSNLLSHVQDQQIANIPFETLGFSEIIKHCTDWPTATYFSSVVQHQNLGHDDSDDNKVSFDGTTYTTGVLGAQEDMADIFIFSAPRGDSVDISLSTSNPAINREFAQELLDNLCETIFTWKEDPSALLKIAPRDVSPILAQTSDSNDSETISPSYEPEGTNPGMTSANLALLEQAWADVLPCDLPLTLKSSFFELGGDLISVGKLMLRLRESGIEVCVEHLRSRPTLQDQLELLDLQADGAGMNGSHMNGSSNGKSV